MLRAFVYTSFTVMSLALIVFFAWGFWLSGGWIAVAVFAWVSLTIMAALSLPNEPS